MLKNIEATQSQNRSIKSMLDSHQGPDVTQINIIDPVTKKVTNTH